MERPQANTNSRWIDRLTLDGTWSGNLFDFHRRVYLKLIAGLKIPFHLEADKRIDETPVHVALREALVNTLVHADYTGRASVLVVKRPDMFGFRNPGLMRISIENALRGGDPDCRNRKLHQMFRYVGLGEQAGSGIPKILEGWKSAHWRPPSVREYTDPYDQTIFELRMLDLFPTGTVEVLQKFFNGKNERADYKKLDHASQVAIALAYSERMVNHERLKQLTDAHSADVSQTLHKLVEQNLLKKTGNSRSAVYYFVGLAPPLGPDDVFVSEPDSTRNKPDSTHNEPDSTHNEPSSTHNEPSSTHNEPSSTRSEGKTGKKIVRNEDGCIISDRLNVPVVDKISKLSDTLKSELQALAVKATRKKRVPPAEMEDVIANLCVNRYMTISALSHLLRRSEKTLRNSYLSKMVKEKKLRLAFPSKPNDPRQAYTANNGENE